jgi:hypothetical protein
MMSDIERYHRVALIHRDQGDQYREQSDLFAAYRSYLAAEEAIDLAIHQFYVEPQTADRDVLEELSITILDERRRLGVAWVEQCPTEYRPMAARYLRLIGGRTVFRGDTDRANGDIEYVGAQFTHEVYDLGMENAQEPIIECASTEYAELIEWALNALPTLLNQKGNTTL